MSSSAVPLAANAQPPSAAGPAARGEVPQAPAGGGEAEPALARLAFLFRHSRSAGRVHVLQHLIQRYRTEFKSAEVEE